jgi:hypothetical protein
MASALLFKRTRTMNGSTGLLTISTDKSGMTERRTADLLNKSAVLLFAISDLSVKVVYYLVEPFIVRVTLDNDADCIETVGSWCAASNLHA